MNRQHAEKLTQKIIDSLIAEHAPDLWASDGYRWEFEWLTRSKRCLGMCEWCRMDRLFIIRLNGTYTDRNGPTEIENTIRHEAAHMLQMLHDLRCDGHGPRWREWARRVGAEPKREASSKTIDMPKGHWVCVIADPESPEIVKRYHRKPKRVTGWRTRRGGTPCVWVDTREHSDPLKHALDVAGASAA